MTDLQALWDKHSTREEQSQAVQKNDLLRLHSNKDAPLAKLRKNIYINTGFAIVILIGFIGLLFYVDGFLFRLFTGILCVTYVAAILFNIYMVRNYLHEPAPDQSLKEYLTTLLYNMNKAFRSVELIALMIYPIAMTAGFLMPLTLEGKIDLIYNEPIVQGILIACYIVLTPLCWYLAKYMNKVAFGKYLSQLEDILKDLNRQD
jgi:hypothetical protein